MHCLLRSLDRKVCETRRYAWTLATRVLLGFAVVSTSFLSGSFQHVGAQSAGEAATTSEPNLEEAAPSSEPAAEQGGSRLERWHREAFVDPEQEPSGSIEYKSPSASQGYSGEGIRPAAIGLILMAGVTVGGVVMIGVGASRSESSEDYSGIGLAAGGAIVMVVGIVGMIATGVMLGRSTLQPGSSQESRYERERRAQWDLQTSRLVF